MSRQIILDTETTGLEVEQGHRLIEIGCLEMKNRRVTGNNFHHYVNPERAIDAGAQQVHGISNQDLKDKPKFRELARELWTYLEGAELIIHNAPFDLGFLNREFVLAGVGRRLEDVCTITDTLSMARRKHPGQKASLDALCKRYGVDNSGRDLHGALLDARLLADVYLAMTGGQSRLTLDAANTGGETPQQSRLAELLPPRHAVLRVIRATEAEQAAHQARLRYILKKSKKLLWNGEVLPASEAAVKP
ncbi:MAG: DNA polymerase III subunit epsilon [Stenotrophobium sp.]